jgi:hypothetical protein
MGIHSELRSRPPIEIALPMTATIQTILLLLAVLVVVAVVARRLNTAPSILLVIAGIGLALAPGLPRIELAPELVLLGILPPLIYSAGFAMSWREFRFNLRPIALLAFGCVLFTTCAVAAAAHWLLGMPLAVGFVLGAIVAPPDVVAPLAHLAEPINPLSPQGPRKGALGHERGADLIGWRLTVSLYSRPCRLNAARWNCNDRTSRSSRILSI